MPTAIEGAGRLASRLALRTLFFRDFRTGFRSKGASLIPPRLKRVGCRSGGALFSVLFYGTIGGLLLIFALPPLLKSDARPDNQSATPTATPNTAANLDPTPYRDLIVSLEQLLYRAEPAGFDFPGQVSYLAMQLSLEVRGGGRNARHDRAYGQIYDYAGVVDAQAESGYTIANLVDIRERWERVRAGVFQDASWFQRSTPVLTMAQLPATPSTDPTVIRQLGDYATELEALIRSGKRQALAINEAGVDAGLNTRESRAAEQEWRSWTQSWMGRIESAARHGPRSVDQRADINIVMAHQELSRAVTELQMVTHTAATTTTIPFKYERERHFDAAAQSVRTAREHLAKLQP